MNIKPYENSNSMECIRCGECIKICPKKATARLSLKEDKSPTKDKEIKKSF